MALLDKTIFVFGSNQSGIHGAGAALFAKQHLGAKQGVGEGMTGKSYALPTKDFSIESLTLKQVKTHVNTFLKYARANPSKRFQVTRVGCNLAGFTDAQIAPLFDRAPDNCLLPGVWLRRRNSNVYRVIVTGPVKFTGTEQDVFAVLDKALKKVINDVEIVTSGELGVERLAEKWALKNDVPVQRFPPNKKLDAKAALFTCQVQMTWYATHLILFNDGSQRCTGMIARAEDGKIRKKVVAA